LCKRRASCRGENRKRARVIGVKRGRVRGEGAQSPSTPTASHTLLGDAISGICENSAERGGEGSSAELLRVPLRLVAPQRRKLLKLAVACFISPYGVVSIPLHRSLTLEGAYIGVALLSLLMYGLVQAKMRFDEYRRTASWRSRARPEYPVG
jgi:hypothetical protein